MSSAVATHHTAQAEKEATNSSSEIRQYMSFWINGRTYAIPLTQVAEITPMCELNQMPHTPKYVEGLLDLRGHVLPVVSLRTRMGLPKNESNEVASILILSHEGSRIGVLVDQVESVITATEDQHAAMSPMLEGVNGIWVIDILLMNDRVILVLDSNALASMADNEDVREQVTLQLEDIEIQLDESLHNLLKMAGSKEDHDVSVYPSLKQVISHTETEMTKVLDSIESMLACTDEEFTGIKKFKQEIAMHDVGEDLNSEADELETITERLQNDIFEAIQQLQYQDIIRQKLERILAHISAVGDVISAGLT